MDAYELSPYYLTLLNSLESIYVRPYPPFSYSDADDLESEIAEFYTYAEIPEFRENLILFQNEAKTSNLPNDWRKFTEIEKWQFVRKQLEKLDVKDVKVRQESTQVVLYIAQGCWEELDCQKAQHLWQKRNVMLLCRLGVFGDYVDQINVELSNKVKKLGNILDTKSLRTILAVLYTILEVMREENQKEDSEYKKEVGEFFCELDNIGVPTIIKLIDMILQRTNSDCYQIPIKKTLLTIWKLLLLYLGDSEEIDRIKRQNRGKFGLSCVDSSEETVSKFQQHCDEHCTGKIPQKIPWTPKVRHNEIMQYLNQARLKYFGYTLDNDFDTLYGFPEHILESINVLKKHTYVPLGSMQMDSFHQANLDQTHTDLLYYEMIPHLKLFLNALCRIVTVSVSSYSDEILKKYSLHAEVMPPNIKMNPTYILGFEVDITRQKEILIKTISGIIYLLLKHLKVNQIYQFECFSLNLLENDFVDLILSFLSLDVKKLCETKTVMRSLEFPHCVLGGPPRYDSNITVGRPDLLFSWRNTFAVVNLLRILNKVVKNKPARIQILLSQLALDTLLPLLNIRIPLMELYVLKLIKMLVKFQGKTWRLNNLAVISKIYHKVRHRLCDNWLCPATNAEIRRYQWNSEEFHLKYKIDKYNKLCTINSDPIPTFTEIQLPDDFENTYTEWLDKEVFKST